MARNIYCRLILTGLLKLNSPLHVGGFGEAVDTDMPLAQNGAGDLYIPGTSLAGTLREYITQVFGISLIEKLWG
jgi:CRISPR/Cas system CSM-associated protein Csm3 (group 7 of RAMP superfamily)